MTPRVVEVQVLSAAFGVSPAMRGSRVFGARLGSHTPCGPLLGQGSPYPDAGRACRCADDGPIHCARAAQWIAWAHADDGRPMPTSLHAVPWRRGNPGGEDIPPRGWRLALCSTKPMSRSPLTGPRPRVTHHGEALLAERPTNRRAW